MEGVSYMAYTITDFLNQNPGYARSYDENTDTGYLKNLMTGKQISFKSGQGQEYGLGGFDQGAQSNTITDVNKLMSSLRGSQTPSQSTPQFQGQNQNTTQNILNQLIGRTQTGFSYNPNSDAALKQAQDQAQRSVMEQMNSRGVLNSTLTADRSAQATAQLVPQYEQMAYSRYQEQNQQLANLANTLQNMDNNQFARYQQEWENNLNERQFAYKQQQDKLSQDNQKIAAAWNRVSQLGYADNESAAILGVQPGTPSAQAREAAQAKADQIERFNMELEAKRQDELTSFNREKELLDKRAAIAEEQNATNFNRDVQLAGISAANQREMANINLSNQKSLADYENQLKVQSSNQPFKLQDYSNYIDNYLSSSKYNDDGKLESKGIDTQTVKQYLTQLFMNGVDENIVNALAAKYGV